MSVNEQQLREAKQEFLKSTGLGQASHYRFAIWLCENEIALSEYIIAAYLSIKSKTKAGESK